MLDLAKFRLELRAEEEISLPSYKGSALRGGFGTTFKKVACALGHGECSKCILRTSCVYSYIFETAVDYLPYFIFTFSELGKLGLGRGRGKFSLVGAWAVSPEGEELAYDGKTFRRPRPYRPAEAGPSEVREVVLEFLTPTRIRYNERLVSKLEFHMLVRSLLRRISLLSYFHCGRELDLDFRGIIRRAQEVEVVEDDLAWYDWGRYSGRQKARMKLGGFVGKVRFRGELGEFWPLLLTGQEVHVGKGTSFGLGWYRMEWSARSS